MRRFVPPREIGAVALALVLAAAAAHSLELDFGICKPGRDAAEAKFGVTRYDVLGLERDVCALEISTVAEGITTSWRCRVPRTLGRLHVETGSSGEPGAEFTEDYCDQLESVPTVCEIDPSQCPE